MLVDRDAEGRGGEQLDPAFTSELPNEGQGGRGRRLIPALSDRAGVEGCCDGGQVLVFALFLLVFVVLLVVGESLVLLGRVREQVRVQAEFELRDGVDVAVAAVTDAAAGSFDLESVFTDGSGGVHSAYGWRGVVGGEKCLDDSLPSGDVDEFLIVDGLSGSGCWRVSEFSLGQGVEGLAGAQGEVAKVVVEVRAGCKPGVDRLEDAPSGVFGCAVSEVVELGFKKRSFLSYVLHYDSNGVPGRWSGAGGLQTAFYAEDGVDVAKRDEIVGPVHTNMSEVLLCGGDAGVVFDEDDLSTPAVDESQRVETAGSGSYRNVCTASVVTGGPSVVDTGRLDVKGLVHDKGFPVPDCDAADVRWLRDAKRAAEAGVAGWKLEADGASVSLADFTVNGSGYEDVDVVYAEGDLTVTAGAVPRPVTLIAEGNLTLEHSGSKDGDPAAVFKANGSTGGRPHVLGLIAGCDIVIDYTQNTLSGPISGSNDLRPAEPPDPDWNQHYPEDGWREGTRREHKHEYTLLRDVTKSEYERCEIADPTNCSTVYRTCSVGSVGNPPSPTHTCTYQGQVFDYTSRRTRTVKHTISDIWDGWKKNTSDLGQTSTPLDLNSGKITIAASASYPKGCTKGTADTNGCSYTSSSTTADTADDEYCVSWPEWVMTAERRTWRDPTTDPRESHINDAPNYDPNKRDSYYFSEFSGAHLDNQEYVTYRTNHLNGQTAWSDYSAPPDSHWKDRHIYHDPGVLSRAHKGIYHSDYYESTADGTPRGSNGVQKPLADRSFAYSHWPAQRMQDPVAQNELCDFMGFKLENVALLAPSGGVRAADWQVPRQDGQDPTVTINGSIAVGYRGLFGRYDKNGSLVTGYRKIFKYPTGFGDALTAWWPELRQDQWAPLPS